MPLQSVLSLQFDHCFQLNSPAWVVNEGCWNNYREDASFANRTRSDFPILPLTTRKLSKQ